MVHLCMHLISEIYDVLLYMLTSAITEMLLTKMCEFSTRMK